MAAANTQQSHEEALNAMATPEFTNELIAYLKIRCPLIYITCNEEKRLLTYFKHLASARGYHVYIWDCYLGLVDLINDKKVKGISDDITDPEAALDKIIEASEGDELNEKSLGKQGVAGNIYILLDFHRYLQDALPTTERRLKRLAKIESMTSVIVTGPHFESTPAIENIFQVLDFPYPNDSEISQTLHTLCGAVASKLPKLNDELESREEELIKSAGGLTIIEAQNAFAKSVVIHKKFDIPTILKIKKQIIRRKGILEYYEPTVGMQDIGGLKNMVHWFERRKLAFHSDAEKYGLPFPRGVLMLGAPGTGKSLAAKAISKLYEMPLLRLDFGRLFNSLVGESERTARECIKVAESMAPAILWTDEIEKGLSGGRSSGQTDGGTTSRVISTFLTWMQEKTSPVFFVCTANDHKSIPPEFMRAGRFDEIFFVDLPSTKEREEIFSVLLGRYKRDPKKFDVKKLAKASEHYSGAELEKAIVCALFEGFSEKQRNINTEDIYEAIGTFKPLYSQRQDTFEEKIGRAHV
jgi:ATP-dependent 26S proteasome regulatory subunit